MSVLFALGIIIAVVWAGRHLIRYNDDMARRRLDHEDEIVRGRIAYQDELTRKRLDAAMEGKSEAKKDEKPVAPPADAPEPGPMSIQDRLVELGFTIHDTGVENPTEAMVGDLAWSLSVDTVEGNEALTHCCQCQEPMYDVLEAVEDPLGKAKRVFWAEQGQACDACGHVHNEEEAEVALMHGFFGRVFIEGGNLHEFLDLVEKGEISESDRAARKRSLKRRERGLLKELMRVRDQQMKLASGEAAAETPPDKKEESPPDGGGPPPAA